MEGDMTMEPKLGSGKVRKTFFGCNTAHGFHTFYDFFPELDNARIFIVKGGPGTGKSTFIGTIAQAMLESGYNIELQFCSLDPGSLDAVVIPEIKAVVVAATGHHVFDPTNPGAVDEIINLGQFWNDEGIRTYVKEIFNINQESHRLFHKVYRYLGAAELIQDNIEDEYSVFLNMGKLNQVIEKLTKSLLEGMEVSDFVGKERHLFVSSITSEGLISHAETITNEDTRIIALRGGGMKTRSEVLRRIAEEGKRRGLLVHYYHYPLNHHFIEQVMMPESNTLISADCYSFINNCNVEVYDLNSFLDSRFHELSSYVEAENLKFKQILDDAVQSLYLARKTHSQLEQYYISNMNFNEVDECRDKTIDKILLHAKSLLKKKSA
jgi:hypothetical protein